MQSKLFLELINGLKNRMLGDARLVIQLIEWLDENGKWQYGNTGTEIELEDVVHDLFVEK